MSNADVPGLEDGAPTGSAAGVPTGRTALPTERGAGAAPERTTARTLARAGLVVAGVYLVARVLGYIRVVVISTTFGADADLDAFFTAFRIPDLIFQLVAAGAVASALVPMVAGLLAKGEQARAWRVVSTIANLMLVGLLLFAAVAFAGGARSRPADRTGASRASSSSGPSS